MPYAAVAVYFHQTADVHADFALKIALHAVLSVDALAQTADLLLG
jgi:hypothetical protein